MDYKGIRFTVCLALVFIGLSFTAYANVAQIGSTQYASLEAAFAAAQDGDTITVLANSSGNGIKVAQGRFTTGLTVNFGGFTYTVDGTLVGSTGTETQAFQLLRDNKITFQNGTITSEIAKILVQNYSNLTLNGMTLTLNNANYSNAYTLSNNNGNVMINNTTINANPAGKYAFDVCRYASYPSVLVTVMGTSVINGDIEMSASNGDPGDGFGLNLLGGTLNGNIVLDNSALTAMADDPDKAFLRKMETFVAAAPYGYCWSGLGVSTLVPAIAVIGNTGYTSLYDAVYESQAGDTIVMLDNSEETATATINYPITVDLNGKTITRTGQALSINANLTITDNSQNGGGSIQASSYGAWIKGGATLTLEKVSLTSNSYAVIVSNGHVVVNNNTTITGNYGILSQSTASNTVTVNGGLITATSRGLQMSAGNLIMNGGTVSSNSIGALVGSGSHTINGGTISGKSYGIVTSSCRLITINDGNIIMNGSYGEALRFQGYSAGIMNGGLISSNDCGVMIATGSGTSTFTLTGGVINAGGIGIANNGQTKSDKATTMNISGGSINANIGIYHPGMGFLNISGGTITGVYLGINFRNGKLDISGGTIHATDKDENDYDFHDNGSTRSGDALLIESSNYGEHIGETFHGETYQGSEVTISYGIFISDKGKAVASYINTDDPSVTTHDGVERCLHFLTNGWYSNDPIPAEHCAEGVSPDPTPHLYSAPDNRALYTIYTPLAWIEKEGVQDNTYTISDQLLAVFALDNSLWCKDLGNASNAFTQPATDTQHDYLHDLLGRTEDWDQSNWVELHFDDATDLSSTLKGYEGYYIKPASITGVLSDKLNYRIEVDRPHLYLEDTTYTYVPNIYCAANFLKSNLVLNEGDTGAPSDVSPHTFYYFLNPKVQEYSLISIVMWDGQNFVLPEKEIGSNVHNFHGCFRVVWDYNMFGDQHENLNTYTQYEFRAIIRRAVGSTYGPAYAPQSGQVPSSNIVVYPIDLKDTSIVTSVDDIKAASVKSVKYVSAAGLVSERPFDGLNIVVTEYSDGSRTTVKQLR